MESLIKDFGNLLAPKIENVKENLNESVKDIVLDTMVLNLEEIMDKWTDNHENNFAGGKMRGDRGEDIERFVRECVSYIAEHEEINIIAKRGNTDFKVLEIKNGETVIKKDHQVDVHIYYNDIVVAVIECKAYLDHCMYIRACDDFEIFKKFGYNIKNAIFALEDSMEMNSKIFTDHVNNNICDNYFYILDGKRSSSKPIYDSRFRKEINKTSLKGFIDFIYKLTDLK